MNNDAEKIGLLNKILTDGQISESFEAVSLALSIQDDEDRDLSLLDTINWLIQNKHWQQAYGAAQLISEGYEKSEALQSVANYLAAIGHLEKAFSVFDEAGLAFSPENFDWQKAELLHKIANSLRKLKAYVKADQVWDRAVAIAKVGEESISEQNSWDSSSVLAEIAENFAAEERTDKAIEIAQKIKNIGKREFVLKQISEYSQRTKRVA